MIIRLSEPCCFSFSRTYNLTVTNLCEMGGRKKNLKTPSTFKQPLILQQFAKSQQHNNNVNEMKQPLTGNLEF